MKAPDICKIVGRDKHHLVQLCLPIEKLKGTLKFPVYASEKLDGVFAFAYVTATECFIYSRTGEEYLSLNHLKAELWELAKVSQCEIIIFEAFAPGVPQPTISGWCRDTKKQHLEVDAYIHDILPLEDFVEGYSEYVYYDRVELLRHSYRQIAASHLHLIEQREMHTYVALTNMAESIWEKGGEGVVVRGCFTGYEPGKRNGTMVKIKKGVSYDLLVTGVEEGTGKYKGAVGKLICRDRNGKLVKVGSGLTDEQRHTWWSPWNYDEIVGKIVQVDAMSISTKGILREPRFKGIRYDKKEADIIE